MTNPYTAIQDTYGLTTSEFLETVDEPYTPAQRTILVTDILNHFQEGSPDGITDNEWDDWYQTTTTASDEKLNSFWNTVAEWILSRRDIPTEAEDPIARQLIADADQNEGQAIIAHQKFKRFHDDYDADYGFLRYQTYHHNTDKESATS